MWVDPISVWRLLNFRTIGGTVWSWKWRLISCIEMSVDPSKNLIHRQDSSKHRFCSGCAIFIFFLCMAFLGFPLRPCHKKARRHISDDPSQCLVQVDQAPSCRLPGKVWGARRQNAPKNASDSAETYPKKNSSNFQSTVCWRSTFSRDSGIFHPPKRAFNA